MVSGMMFESNLLTRRRIDFGALLKLLAYGVRPNDSFYQIGGAEAAFELYRWMTNSVTGSNFERWSWPTRWTRESLAKNMSSRVNCGSDGNITPFRCSYDRHQDARPSWGWRHELASRFAHALLDEGKMAEWRAAMKIDLAKPRMVSMLTYDHIPPPPRSTLRGCKGDPLGWRPSWGDPLEGNGFAGEIDRLFALATPTRRLREQMNTSHTEARYLQAVTLWPTHDGWVASIEYGYKGSSWSQDYRIKGWTKSERARDKTHCAQRKGEPFSNFIYRAHDQFDALLTPICRTIVPCSYGDGFTERPRSSPRWDDWYAGERCEAGP